MGGLIYSGIEIGVFIEAGFGLYNAEICANKSVVLLRPFLQMVFIFIQMYFIFLNHKVRELLNGTLTIISRNLSILR
jgi:hypothetical protein